MLQGLMLDGSVWARLSLADSSSNQHSLATIIYSYNGENFTEANFQSIHAATRLFTGTLTDTRWHDHVTPVFCSLHWISMLQTVSYKLAVLTQKALNSQLPSHLPNDYQLTANVNTGSYCLQMYQGS